MKRFIIAHETGSAIFSTIYVVGGGVFFLWLGNGIIFSGFALSVVVLALVASYLFPRRDTLSDILREYHIVGMAQNAVPMRCGTCRMFKDNRCHRVAPFAEVTVADFCMKYDINPKCDEYVAAFKAAEESFK